MTIRTLCDGDFLGVGTGGGAIRLGTLLSKSYNQMVVTFR